MPLRMNVPLPGPFSYSRRINGGGFVLAVVAMLAGIWLWEHLAGLLILGGIIAFFTAWTVLPDRLRARRAAAVSDAPTMPIPVVGGHFRGHARPTYGGAVTPRSVQTIRPGRSGARRGGRGA